MYCTAKNEIYCSTDQGKVEFLKEGLSLLTLIFLFRMLLDFFKNFKVSTHLKHIHKYTITTKQREKEDKSRILLYAEQHI